MGKNEAQLLLRKPIVLHSFMPKVHYTFPRNFPVEQEVANLLRTC